MRGFSLIELMIVVVIFIGILGALLISLLTGRRAHVSGDAYVEVQQEARRAVEEMIKELHGSQSDRMYLSGVSTVVFQVPNDNDEDGSVATGGTLEWGAPDAASGCIRYALNDTQIERSLLSGPLDAEAQSCGDPVGGADTRIVGNHVTDLTFTSVTGGLTIEVTTQVTNQLPGPGQSATITGRAQFRNL